MSHDTDLDPFVSIIVPIRNEAEFIEQCLRSLLNDDYPRDRMEILVMDGMSNDGTREIVQRLAQSDNRVRLLDNPERIVPHAMNSGIRAARGEIITRLDGHADVLPGFLRRSVE
ncbi:MAG: glycosyltransferase, partial [Phycisphaerae bacterium]|nr:glycosyltransferase [Phycisphaerae bacterium]